MNPRPYTGCRIKSFYVAPKHAWEPATAQSQCVTHQWSFLPGTDMTTVNALCPVGRIEEAIESGLARIEEMLKAGKDH